jgi:hypothetical protein
VASPVFDQEAEVCSGSTGKAQNEQKISALPPIATVAQTFQIGSYVPQPAFTSVSRVLFCFRQGPRDVANTTDEILHYGAFHSVFQRDEPDEEIDRQLL